ncbi:NUDIX domain-containing protein [Actinoplanes sp. TBRC 11911]|uniref:NUDIX domain-containing protein n=1 Tax=Actinoplanes sp. TBRC 11911 TaxID=2729386 RepID=UPI001B7D69B9|nr:NUDIX domain-containing protein [Actinoplanes sp. TBRC 11911]
MTVKSSQVHHQIICANVFIRRGGRLLVLRRSPTRRYAANVVHPVGGKVEPDENPFAAAAREVKEETGLKVTNMRLEAVLLDLAPVPGEPHNWLIYHFSADWAAGEPHETDEGELVWMSPAEFVQQPLHPSLQGIAEHILDPRKGTLFVTHTYNADGGINGRFKNECVNGRPLWAPVWPLARRWSWRRPFVTAE